MTASELLTPRYKVINTYPDCHKVGDFQGKVISLNDKGIDGEPVLKRGSSSLYSAYFNAYPHIYKKLQWWEYRTEGEMPKKLKSLPFGEEEGQVVAIEKWDMNLLFGFTNTKTRSGCGLTTFNPEYGYIPFD